MFSTRPAMFSNARFSRTRRKQVSRDALKEERTPLLDLDDVEQFESELASCFDAPPPPPLNIRVSVVSFRFSLMLLGKFLGTLLDPLV